MKRSITEQVAHHFWGMTVPPDHVVLVLNNGNPQRLVGPGQAQLHSIWESFGPLIHVGPRPFDFSLENVRSKDGIPFRVRVSGYFRFDPRHAAGHQSLTLAYRYGYFPAALKERVAFIAERAVRSVLGEYNAETLCGGEIYHTAYSGRIVSITHREALFEGIQFERVITVAQPPASYETLMQYTRLNEKALAIYKDMEKIEALANANIQITHLSMDDGVKELLSQLTNSLSLSFPRIKLN